jgi:hypothetical protein
VTQDIPANDLCSGSRGHCLGTARGFYSLVFLLYSLTYFVAYVAKVFSCSRVGFSCSDGCTHGFFTYGSAGCPSSCCAAPVVEIFALSLGSP